MAASTVKDLPQCVLQLFKESQGRLYRFRSDQGSRFTSKVFIDFCKSMKITQSMSKAGYPYDNAPMERYCNTLKNKMIYHHFYHSDQELNDSVDNFAYVLYNLGMYVGENESAKFWLSIMNGLKNRDVEDILITCVEGLTGLQTSIGGLYNL